MKEMKVKLEWIIVDDDVIESAKSWTCCKVSEIILNSDWRSGNI